MILEPTPTKSSYGAVYVCRFRVVWCTKYRREVLIDGADVRTLSVISDVCSGLLSSVVDVNVMPDHVNLLVDVDPRIGIHRLVKRIKSVSSGKLRNEFKWIKSRLPTLWTNLYLVSTEGFCSQDRISQYLLDQRRGR